MATPWAPQVDHIRDGEAVQAAVAGRPDRALEARTQHLKDVVDGAVLGEALFARDRPLEPGLEVGMAVYWDATRGRFAGAHAAWGLDPATRAPVPEPPAFALGLLYAKDSDTLGVVLLQGTAELAPAMRDGGAAPYGFLYLSNEAGRLAAGPVPVGPAVAFADGAGRVYVQPALRTLTHDHTHYSVRLACRPAGRTSPPAGGHDHVVTDADASEPGWLPADHPVFRGRAPHGACFGYNVRAHGTLDRVWPPAPPEAAALVWDKGAGHVGGTDVPLGPDGLAVVDRNGVWWMSRGYGDVPWPADYDSADPGTSSSFSSEAGDGTPRHEEMRLTLHFARTALGTAGGVVTSLAPRAGSPIRVVDCAGQDATDGALQLELDADWTLGGGDQEGHLAVKSQDGPTFLRGPVVEGVFAHPDGSVVLTSTAARTVGGATLHQGRVTVQAVLEPGERLLLSQVVDLSDVAQRNTGGVLYLGFPAGQASAVRVKFTVPTGPGLPESPALKLRLWVLGRAAGTLPDLTFSYRRVARPSGLTPVSLPTTDASGTLDTTAAVAADQYVEAETGAVAVAAGDEVFVTLARGASDGYAGEVGVVTLLGVLVRAED